MIERFLERTEFSSYEDFKQNYKLKIPENFNFAYDVIDEWANIDKNKLANFLDLAKAGIGISVNNKIAQRALDAEKPLL